MTLSAYFVASRPRLRSIAHSLAVAMAVLLLACDNAAHGNWETTNPTPNSGPDKNPLKGFNSGWWNPNQDFASIGYQTLEWGQLEPIDDIFDTGYIEGVLDRDGSKGRHVVVQLHIDWCCNTQDLADNYKGPAWLKDDLGVATISALQNNDPAEPRQATDYNDPVFITEAVEAIDWLTNYLRDDPRTFVIQTGMLGWWGEWHTFGLDGGAPGLIAKETIRKAYLEGIGPEGFMGTFPGGANGVLPAGVPVNNPGIGPDGLTQVRFPDDPVNVPSNGVGYVNGFIIPTTHGYELGVEVDAHDLWKDGPVGGEVPPLSEVTDDQLHRFFETEEGEFLLRQGRYTHLLTPEEHHLQPRLPGWTQQDEYFLRMHRTLGYNFQVSEVRYLDSRDTSGDIQIEVDLQNVGIAPFYKDWDVELAVLDASGGVVDIFDVDFDLRELMPGDGMTLAATLGATLDSTLDYQLALRILQPGAADPKAPEWLSSWQKLDADNTYVVLANDVSVVPGVWDDSHHLLGGWNVLDMAPGGVAGFATSRAVPEPTTAVLFLTASLIGIVATFRGG